MTLRLRGIVPTAAICLTMALCAPASISRAAPPPHPDRSKALARIPTDPRPPALTRNNHYFVSNEYHNQVFYRDAKPLGGVYVGVGSEQNYVFASWYRPDVMVLMDFDQMIVDLHAAYEVAFLKAPDVATFRALWGRKGRKLMHRHIQEHFASQPAVARGAWRAYRWARVWVSSHLRRARRRYLARGVPTFLTDPEHYAFIVRMLKEGRVRRVRGNLLGPRTMAGIGAAARELGLPVRLVYLSNAEQYFKYSTRYRSNIAALPFDDRTIVLRTLARNKKEYWYVTQPGKTFKHWLQTTNVRRVKSMLRRRMSCQPNHLCQMQARP